MASGDEERRISTVAAVILTVAVGAAMAYLGFVLARFGVYAFGEGERLLGAGAALVGVVLVGIPVAVVVGQLRATLRRRK